MTGTDYKKVFQDLKDELEALLEQQEKTEKRIMQVKQSIVAIAPLAEEDDFVKQMAAVITTQMGITDSCRETLKTAGRPLTPIQVREELKKSGMDIKGYTNILASIHSVLKRLLESGEAKSGTNAEGDTTYEWKRATVRHRHIGLVVPPPRVQQPIPKLPRLEPPPGYSSKDKSPDAIAALNTFLGKKEEK
jgi:hypothetical protein